MQPLYVLSMRQFGVWRSKVYDPVSGSSSPQFDDASYFASIGRLVLAGHLDRQGERRRVVYITCGSKHYGNGESMRHWWLLRGRPNDADLEEILIDLGITETYRGPGEFFKDGASWRRSPHHTLITQRVGWDV